NLHQTLVAPSKPDGSFLEPQSVLHPHDRTVLAQEYGIARHDEKISNPGGFDVSAEAHRRTHGDGVGLVQSDVDRVDLRRDSPRLAPDGSADRAYPPGKIDIGMRF